jgi:16S rRNA (adenine1518-N6/adenine1519-N6)-dimethyltransferase
MTSASTLLKAWNLRPKKQLGQNFLSDPTAAEKIVSSARISPTDCVLEIGAGLGALTVPLARCARRVYAIEKDRHIAALLRTELLTERLENAVVIEEDAVKANIRSLAEEAGQPLIVAGNLPYNISSQIVVKLIRNREMVRHAVLMFQKELAARLTARPATKAYGRLTVMLGYCAEVKPVMTLSASAFYPKPKVDSEVVLIRFTPPPHPQAADEAWLFQVIQAAFGKRRKTLKNALSASSLQIGPESALQAMATAGIDPSRRAETLTVAEFVLLSNTLQDRAQPLPHSCS